MAAVGVLIGSVLVLTALAAPPTAAAQDDDALLDLRAPSRYAGVVVDAVTGKPIPDAVVILFWEFPRPDIDGVRDTGPVRETMTNAAGAFAFDAAEVQSRLARKTYFPRLVVFKPRYTPFPERFMWPSGALALPFASGSGATTVSLRELASYEDRAEAFNEFLAILNSPGLLGDRVPIAWDLVKAALQDFGVPLPPQQLR
jgi:hypothetical protein